MVQPRRISDLDRTEDDVAAPESRRPRAPVGASLLPLPVAFVSIAVVSFKLLGDTAAGPLAWYTTVVWSIPALLAVQGIFGAVVTRLRTASQHQPERDAVTVGDLLVVTVPTIGRRDMVHALERVLDSFALHLKSRFPRHRVDVVIEEDSEAIKEIARMVQDHPCRRLIVVPLSYRTENGTRFKARANQYANELRVREGEARDDVWVLHMDDDTGIGADTVIHIARFIDEQDNSENPAHLAQGVLCYPREHAANKLTWLADAVRPGCDLSFFGAATGGGTPSVGLHGELLLIRASIEAEIGWDFGPRSLVEDAEFSLLFAQRFPGRSGWFPARSYGASPTTVRDFIRQRERWVWGLLELVTKRGIPRRVRARLLINVTLWSLSPIQHPLVVLLCGMAIGDLRALPLSPAFIFLWSGNMAFFGWLYWEGLKVNARASHLPRRRWFEPILLIAMIPLFALWEVAGIFSGVVKAARRATADFTVISKPI